MHGKDGEDLYINVPAGATITEEGRDRTHRLMEDGEVSKILLGGHGGLGNEYFKSSTNRTPEKCTEGKMGEEGTFNIELSLLVDIGLIGLPNAGKSTLLNTLTNASARIGEYPFTTLEPHLGDLFGYAIADIPGLIEGASEGKGLGHKFLKHVRRTKMLVHCVSFESEDMILEYNTIRGELENFDKELLEKDEWIVLTKTDLVDEKKIKEVIAEFKNINKNVYAISAITEDGVKDLGDALIKKLREETENKKKEKEAEENKE